MRWNVWSAMHVHRLVENWELAWRSRGPCGSQTWLVWCDECPLVSCSFLQLVWTCCSLTSSILRLRLITSCWGIDSSWQSTAHHDNSLPLSLTNRQQLINNSEEGRGNGKSRSRRRILWTFRRLACLASNQPFGVGADAYHCPDPGILTELLLLRDMSNCKNFVAASATSLFSLSWVILISVYFS